MSSEKRSLAEIAAEVGTLVPCAGNLPLDLGDSNFAWFVERGTVNVFIEERKDGIPHAPPQHLLQAGTGRLLPNVAPNEGSTVLSIVAKGEPDTIVRRMPTTALNEMNHAELANQVDSWVFDFSVQLSRFDPGEVRADMLADAGESRVEANGVVSSQRGVIWVLGLSAGDGLYLGLLDPSSDESSDGMSRQTALPLIRATWISFFEPRQISAHRSETLARNGTLADALTHFHNAALSLERINRSLAIVDEVNLARDRVTSRQSAEEGARQRLFDLYDSSPQTVSDGPGLMEVLEIIGRHEGIDFKCPDGARTDQSSQLLANILDASGVRARRVALRENDNWRKQASGAMLAFLKEDGRPVALLPGKLGGYRAEVGSERLATRVTEKFAESLSSEAWLFYEPLAEDSTTMRAMLRLAFRGHNVNFMWLIATGLLGGLALLSPAIFLGIIAEQAIPNSEVEVLYVLGGALAVAALLAALLQVLQGMALMRIEGGAATRAEAAFCDRLLRLPPKFLRGYTQGELTTLGMTFQTLRDSLQAVLAHGVLSMVFLIPAFVVAVLYDPILGIVANAFGTVSLLITLALCFRLVAPHSRLTKATRKLTGRLYQIINGISVLRLEGAEGSAFAIWAQGYREQKRAELDQSSLEEHIVAINVSMPILAGAALLVAASFPGQETSIRDFLVVYAIFMVYQSFTSRFGASVSALAAVMPAIAEIRPFLAEPVEKTSEGKPVDALYGDIRFDDISFRYHPDGPLVLDGVSIHARPGEFVAITGESGAGKSTLFRLMLGLDHPTSGAVYFDGQDLKQLNVKQVRRRIGVIPQDVQLHPVDVWDNIVGGDGDATGDDAWSAAKLAVVDKQIEAMPMKMMTCVSVGLISGGESQRINIAKAHLSNPRILLLDEATNWLDNESQAAVMHNLAQLNATRFVIAHRLSTLRQADRIYVMRDGRVAEVGTFCELTELDGLFSHLVRRQIL